MTDPTTGGVSASLALLGDINIAKPGALICFAGPRVIEQTTGETLPEGFQRAEFLLEKGAIDMILDRRAVARSDRGAARKAQPSPSAVLTGGDIAWSPRRVATSRSMTGSAGSRRSIRKKST